MHTMTDFYNNKNSSSKKLYQNSIGNINRNNADTNNESQNKNVLL